MITNGMVSVEDGKKALEEYAPARKVRVDLHFTVDEGADEKAVLHDAGVVADAQVRKLLGMKATDVAEKAAVIDAPVAEKKPGRKKAETLPAVETFSIEGETAKVQPKADETLIDDSILGGGVEPAPKVDVSDKALYDLVVSINAKVKKPKEITEIITRFCPQDGVPPSLKRVPEAKRVEFITAVKAFAEAAK